MVSVQTFALFVLAVLTFLASAESFFLYSSKKTSQERGGMAPQYFRDTSPQAQIPWGPQQYSFDGSGPVTVALPVAVPIQAQMAPLPSSLKGSVHNMQLVPCLCPVSRDMPEPMFQQHQQHQQQQQQQAPQQGYIVQNIPSNSQPTSGQN